MRVVSAVLQRILVISVQNRQTKLVGSARLVPEILTRVELLANHAQQVAPPNVLGSKNVSVAVHSLLILRLWSAKRAVRGD